MHLDTPGAWPCVHTCSTHAHTSTLFYVQHTRTHVNPFLVRGRCAQAESKTQRTVINQTLYRYTDTNKTVLAYANSTYSVTREDLPVGKLMVRTPVTHMHAGVRSPPNAHASKPSSGAVVTRGHPCFTRAWLMGVLRMADVHMG